VADAGITVGLVVLIASVLFDHGAVA